VIAILRIFAEEGAQVMTVYPGARLDCGQRRTDGAAVFDDPFPCRNRLQGDLVARGDVFCRRYRRRPITRRQGLSLLDIAKDYRDSISVVDADYFSC
jgi:hypothetical protein